MITRLFSFSFCTVLLSVWGFAAPPKSPGLTQKAYFMENKGQIVDPQGRPVRSILYKLAAPGVDAYITTSGLTYIFHEDVQADSAGNIPDVQLRWERVDMLLQSAILSADNVVREVRGSASTDFYLPHCPDGIRNVMEFEKLTFRNVYPGIDWVLYQSDKSGFKYDFIVQPGTDPALIRMLYRSAAPMTLSDGALHFRGALTELTEHAPVCFTQENRTHVDARYVIAPHSCSHELHESLVTFSTGKRPVGEVLVIDPQLVWCTSVGGSGYERIRALTHDRSDNIYITGLTQSGNTYPVLSGGTFFQGTTASTMQASTTLFISRFDAQGVMKWSTFYGGSSQEQGMALAVDSLDNLYVTGFTTSVDFPVISSGGFFQSTNATKGDVFIVKFDKSGNRQWATFCGGSDLEWGMSLATDPSGNLYVGGLTYSQNFPLQNAGGYYNGQPVGQGHNTGYLMKFSPSAALLWSTYFPCDRAHSISTNHSGELYVTGFNYVSHVLPLVNPGNGAYFRATPGQTDGFIAKFDPSTVLKWSTYYGGKNDDNGYCVLADARGNVFLTGLTRSDDLPVIGEGNVMADSMHNKPPLSDVFMAKFTSTHALAWATYCGGNGYELMSSMDNLAADACSNIYLTFEANAYGASQTACEGGFYNGQIGAMDLVVTRFSNNGVKLWSTNFGADASEVNSPVEVDERGNLFVAGSWDKASSVSSYTFADPGNGAYYINSVAGSTDGFIARFDGGMITQAPTFSYAPVCVFESGTIAPVFQQGKPPGGAFSISKGLTINTNNGIITYSNVVPGTYTISYNVPGCPCTAEQLTYMISDCTGLEPLSRRSQFLVYPNPAAGVAEISAAYETGVLFYDALGRYLFTVQLNALNNFHHTISGLCPGMYFLRTAASAQATKLVIAAH